MLPIAEKINQSRLVRYMLAFIALVFFVRAGTAVFEGQMLLVVRHLAGGVALLTAIHTMANFQRLKDTFGLTHVVLNVSSCTFLASLYPKLWPLLGLISIAGLAAGLIFYRRPKAG